LLTGAIVAAVGSGVTGAAGLSFWNTVSTDSANKLCPLQPGQNCASLGGLPQDGSYVANKNLVEPLGIASEIALAVAVGLGITTWVVW
jgi:hypothetical protein